MRTERSRHPRRPRGRHAATVAALVLGTAVAISPVTGAAAAPRAASPAASAGTPDPHAAAAATARRTGTPVPVDALTTETSATVANPDGTFTTTTSVQATRMHDAAGGWQNLDPTLRVLPDGTIGTVATPNRLVLTGGGTGPVVSVDDTLGHSMALTLPTSLPKPTLSGASATYSGVYPGVDLTVTAHPSGGFSEVFTVHDAAAAQTARNLRFGTGLHGLRLSQDTDGNMFAADSATGRTLWSAPPAEMWDSAAGVTGLQDSPETVQATAPSSSASGPGTGAHRGHLPIVMDAAGLGLGGDPARLGTAPPTYPLYLDPSWQLPTQSGGTLVDGNARQGCPSYTTDTSINYLGVGYNDFTSCIGAIRSFYQISTANILPASYIVRSATLKINEVTSALNSCGEGSETISIYTTGSNISGVTWNNKPAPVGSAITAKSISSVGGTKPCSGGTVAGDFDVLNGINAARAGGWSTWTFVMIGNESPGYSLEGFNNNPSIVTVYDVAPSTPTATVASPAPVRSDGSVWQGCDGAVNGYLARSNWGGQSTAQLSAHLSSGVGQAQLHGHFEFYDHTVSGGKEWFIDSTTVPGSGGTVTVTSPVLTDGHEYTWQVNADDGYYAGPTAHYCGFVVDISAPSNPVVQSGDFQPVGSSTPSAKRAGQAGLFTVTASDPSPGSGLRGFDYSLDTPVGGAGTQFAASSGSLNLDVTPTAWGVHTLYVQAVDNAGNLSASSQYIFYAPWNQASKVAAGDINGDGIPDLAATAGTGNLVLYPGGTDPSVAPTVLSDAAHSPKGNGWNKYLVTHRGSFSNQGDDDLFAYDTAGHGLFVVKNGGASPFQNPSNLTAITKAEVATDANNTSPTTPDGPTTACATTTTGSCTGYDNTDWSSTTQMLAVGDFYHGDTNPATCGGTAATTCDNGTPGLLTVENGSLWYYQGQPSPNYLGTAVQLGTSGWSGVTLVAPGLVNGAPALWARDDSTGALYQYMITFDANGWPKNLGTPASGTVIAPAGSYTSAAYPTLLSPGDANGDGYPDLFGIAANGTLAAFPGQSTAGGAPPVATSPAPLTGSGWTSGGTAVEPTVNPGAPHAALALSPTSVTVGTAVTADASGSTPGASPLQSYAFDFGDGTKLPPGVATLATHAYATAGAYTVTVTVTDGTGATGIATGNVTVTSAGNGTACPCSVLWPDKAPATVDSGDGNPYELGLKVQPGTAGNITGVRFYKSAANTGTHTGSLWSASGTLLATGTFTNETASGWQTLQFANPVPVQAGPTYVVSYHTPSGHYSYDAGYFTAGGSGGASIRALQDGVSGPNGAFAAGSASAFPTSGNGGANYWVDAVFDTAGVPTGAPTITASTPAASATGVATTTQVSATFSAPVDPSTLTFTLTDGTGAQVPASLAYSGTGSTATLTLRTQLPTSTAFTAAIKATDVWGHAMSSAATWTFTTGAAGAAYTCPCSLFSTTDTPAVLNSGDTNSAELGTRFAPTANGRITGIRFYKGTLNTGTHTGTLWSATGTQLATGTFTNETASGWQTLTFANPVPVQAGTTYVASYHAPNGDYSDDAGYFGYQHINGPLTAPANTSSSGNGLYAYGAATAFPANSGNGADYWVDPIFGP